MSEFIEVTILVPSKEVRFPDSVVISHPAVPGEPKDEYVKETGDMEIEHLGYKIVSFEEEKADQLILDRYNEE